MAMIHRHMFDRLGQQWRPLVRTHGVEAPFRVLPHS